MNIYILAEFPFALKRDGKELAKNAKYCELSADGNSVLEIMPLDLSPARCFSPSEAFFRAADENAVKVRMENGGFLKLKKPRSPLPYELLFQKRLAGALVTAYADGVYKLSVETKGDYKLIAFEARIVDAGEFFAFNRDFIYARAEDGRLVCLLAGERAEIVFDGQADSFGFENGFYTVCRRRDCFAHETRVYWTLSGAKFVPAETAVSKGRDREIPDVILPYALAEALLAGEDPARYLSDNMRQNAAALGGYFGNFTGVFPPPRREGDVRPRLLYRETEGVYRARTLQCEVISGRIDNLTII